MMLLLMPVTLHDTKCHCASHFDHLDLTKGMLLLITLLASCYNDTSNSGITSSKCYVVHCFKHLDLMNTMVLLTMPFVSHERFASANSVKVLKKSHVASHFNYLELTNAMVLLMEPNSVM